MARFVYTITTGRSGSAYLAALLKANSRGANVFHERTGPQDYGQETPEVSHLQRFNHFGNIDYVQSFWRAKFTRNANLATPCYVETSHVLAKAGLIENSGMAAEHGHVHVVCLRRDIVETVWSLANRFDFANVGTTWLFYLDPHYPRHIVQTAPFLPHGMWGQAIWYVLEMRVREAYYRQRFAGQAHLSFHPIALPEVNDRETVATLLNVLGCETTPETIVFPPRTNETRQVFFGEAERQSVENTVANLRFDAEALAQEYIEKGGSLG